VGRQEANVLSKHRDATGAGGYESDDAAYKVQEDGEIVFIGEDCDEENDGEEEERATTNRKRKAQPANKATTTKARGRKKPTKRPKPLTPIKKPSSKKAS
jgi:hypothetical protein